MRLEDALAAMPVVAILRGVRPDEAADIGEALVAEGIVAIEVPLNSPAPCESIARLTRSLGDRAAIGAGTVLSAVDVARVAEAGGTFVVAPDIRVSVVRAAVAAKLEPVPGFATPTEALRALRAGARFLKLFPAATLGVDFVGAVRAVLPAGTAIVAVGGVDASNAVAWLDGGATALGTGSSLYTAGKSAAQVRTSAHELVAALGNRN